MRAGTTARARVRAELTREILDAARRQLAESGAASLSLRAVARSLEMAPSGLYRYFNGRDDLLTALIIDSYEAVGAAASLANATVLVDDHLGRWTVVTDTIWAWGHDHPHEWALVYGSPVPGYRAPEETIAAAMIVTGVLTGVIADAAATGRLAPAVRRPLADPDLSRNLDGLRPLLGDLDDDHLVAGVLAWSQIFGLISLDLFGHLEGGVHQPEALWRQVMALNAHLVGLRPVGA
ncbi:MAG: TetR/AcrR family transcriptional regulator [Actinomycetota bacterium]|nr:TetR/AcrR family transcriptional regulator [Actinomycetota bacterium]